MNRLDAWLGGRWSGRALALGAGLCAALAHPPWGLLPGLLGYGLIMLLAEAASPVRPLRSAFLRGWLAGLAYFALSTWWVSEAFLVDARQTWMAPIALTLMGGGLALFWGLGALAYRATRPAGAGRVLVFAGIFAVVEWLRGTILTGFPWNLPGETWRAGSAPSQAAAFVGVYGLTWITLAIAAGLVVVREGRAGRRAASVAAAALAALYVGGAARLAGAPADDPAAPLVRIVQADVKQEDKWDPAYFRDIFGRYLALTQRPGAEHADLIVWPEGALPASANEVLSPEAWTYPALAAATPPGGLLVLGAYRIAGTPAKPDYYNSLIALRRAPQGLTVAGLYDKHKLTPFGEYVPFDNLAERLGLKTLAHVGDGFTPGAPPAPIELGGLRVQPLICYESLFPVLVRRATGEGARPRLLLNISNDAWFGVTSGPIQHLNLASYRAIETGLPMVRATPTGVSAVVDAYGRAEARLTSGTAGVLDQRVPPKLETTPYARLGEVAFLLLLVLSALVPVFSGLKRRLQPGINDISL